MQRGLGLQLGLPADMPPHLPPPRPPPRAAVDTSKTRVLVVPEDDPTAVPVQMSLAQLGGHNRQAMGELGGVGGVGREAGMAAQLTAHGALTATPCVCAETTRQATSSRGAKVPKNVKDAKDAKERQNNLRAPAKPAKVGALQAALPEGAPPLPDNLMGWELGRASCLCLRCLSRRENGRICIAGGACPCLWFQTLPPAPQ